jgi:hypothetical protein
VACCGHSPQPATRVRLPSGVITTSIEPRPQPIIAYLTT